MLEECQTSSTYVFPDICLREVSHLIEDMSDRMLAERSSATAQRDELHFIWLAQHKQRT